MVSTITRIGVAIALGAFLLAGGPPAHAQKKTTIKIALFTPKVAASARWFEVKKKELEKKTNGRLELQMYYGSSMGPMPRHHDLARTGVADMSFFQHGVTPGRFPLTELFHLPYMFPPGAKGSLIASKVSAELKDKYLAAEHIKVGTKEVWVVFNRPSGVYDSKKPIRSLEDLKGRRYRAPTPTDVIMMKQLGALPIGMPATQMAESLQKGTIDGVVTDPMGVFSFRLGNLVTYYSNMFVSVISFGLVINPKAYAKLPAEFKGYVDAMGTTESSVAMAKMTWSDFPAFTKYMGGLKIKEVHLSKEADAAMRAQADRVVEQKVASLEKKGLPAREMVKKMKALVAKFAKE